MTERQDFDDVSEDELLAMLGEALAAADPVPEVVHEYALAAMTMRSLDAELAELVFDSAVSELAGVRSGSEGTREITFRAPGVEIEVVVVSEDSRRLIGQLVPPQAATIELRSSSGTTVTTETDDLGSFSFDDVPPGNVSLRCVLGDDQTIQTDWIVV